MACLKRDMFFIYFKKMLSYLYMPVILKTHTLNLPVVIRSNTCYFTDLVVTALSKSGQALNVTQLKKVRPPPYTCYFYLKKVLNGSYAYMHFHLRLSVVEKRFLIFQ